MQMMSTIGFSGCLLTGLRKVREPYCSNLLVKGQSERASEPGGRSEDTTATDRLAAKEKGA